MFCSVMTQTFCGTWFPLQDVGSLWITQIWPQFIEHVLAAVWMTASSLPRFPTFTSQFTSQHRAICEFTDHKLHVTAHFCNWSQISGWGGVGMGGGWGDEIWEGIITCGPNVCQNHLQLKFLWWSELKHGNYLLNLKTPPPPKPIHAPISLPFWNYSTSFLEQGHPSFIQMLPNGLAWLTTMFLPLVPEMDAIGIIPALQAQCFISRACDFC